MRYSPYPAYKPSGVEWLGDVPEHWNITTANFAFSIQLGKMLQPEAEGPTDEEVPYLKAQHVQWEDVKVDDLPTMWASESDRVKYAIRNGDLLVCEGGDVGRAGIVRSPPAGTIIQNALHRVRAKDLNEIKLLMYILEHAAARGWFEIICNRATIAHFTGEKFAALSLALPLPSEQRAIVDFLDHQTARIDTLVATRRTLIEKLKEKRTALISHTVTRGLPPDAARAAGLDPHPPLKPSGVEWLGEVPEGWEVLPLKRKFRVVNGGTPASTEEMYWDGDVTWVTPDDLGKIETQKIAHSRRQITKDGLDNCSARLVPCSSIIMSTRAPIGHIAIADVEVCTNQGCRSLVPLDESVLSDFIYYSLIGSKAVLQAKGKGTTFMELSSEDLGSHIVTVPSYLEQCAIANFLDRETVKIDRMVSLEEAVIERQQEYRSALITAAVTGKIDVRVFSHEHGTGSMRSAET